MTRWRRGEVTIERLLADGRLQLLTGAAANGESWLSKARRTIVTAATSADTDSDSSFTLAYDAARFACVALLSQQGLRVTVTGGHYAVDEAVREQFGGKFQQFGGLRRQRNDIEYPVVVLSPLSESDARSAIALAKEIIEAAEQLLPHLGLFG